MTNRRWARSTIFSSRSAKPTCAPAWTNTRLPEWMPESFSRADALASPFLKDQQRTSKANMKGDFTRDTFDARKSFSRVLMQQGRVTLDADFNEQTSILLHYLRTLARDIIGPYAAPIENPGFVISADDENGLRISAGRYYVDGLLVENASDCFYAKQPYPVSADDDLLQQLEDPSEQTFWLYLDVWERHITALEDESIREKALGGPDTCTRAKIAWQVRAVPVEVEEGDERSLDELRFERADLQSQANATENFEERQKLLARIAAIGAEIARRERGDDELPCDAPLDDLVGISNATLAARVDPGRRMDDPCITPPDSKYRGTENQLYRVEIHRGGAVGAATFKWSRDNGSVATAWVGTSGHDVQVSSARGFAAGDWVELSDDRTELDRTPGLLVKVAKVEAESLSVDPTSLPASATLALSDDAVNPKVRRWNQTQSEDIQLTEGAVSVSEASATDPAWIDLEDGVQIRFSAGGQYRTGDYWLIPARVATGDIEWPSEPAIEGDPVAQALPPRGIQHHYAPLGYASWNNDHVMSFQSCHCEFEPLSSCFSLGSIATGAHMLRSAAPVRVVAPERRGRG